MSERPTNRREMLKGESLREAAGAVREKFVERSILSNEDLTPTAGSTVRLSTPAMGTEFGLVLNSGDRSHLWPASTALDRVGEIEEILTVYRPESTVSNLNRLAAEGAFAVDDWLWNQLILCDEFTRQTFGAFDVATHAQIELWQRCRQENRVATDREIEIALNNSGWNRLRLVKEDRSVKFECSGVGLNFGAIGKGMALDECARQLLLPVPGGGKFEDDGDDPLMGKQRPLDNFCLYGGFSSVLSRGMHDGHEGWPVGIGNPLFTSRRLGTLLIRDLALATSGSNVQFFRHEGERYGHILDPRTARPARGLLSATVVAPTAAIADAFSTAFFVLGVEKACEICDNNPSIGALLIPPPDRGGRLRPVIRGLSDDCVFLDPEQVTIPS